VTAAAIIPLILLATAPQLFAQRVEIRLQGRYYAEPATVRILVAVEPDATNRVLRIEADGEQMFRSSEFSLTEDAGKRFYTVEFKNLAAGAYVVRAEVLSSTTRVAEAEEPLIVTTAS
jgi:hypothetical protein